MNKLGKFNKIETQKVLSYHLKGVNIDSLTHQIMLLLIVYVGKFGIDDFIKGILNEGVGGKVFSFDSLEGLFD